MSKCFSSRNLVASIFFACCRGSRPSWPADLQIALTARNCRRAITAALLFICLGMSPSAAQVLLSDFNNSGFTYTFGQLSQTMGPNAVRLTGPSSASGAGLPGSLDLSAYTDGRISVDFVAHEDNKVDTFLVELLDANSITGKWAFSAASALPGVSTNLVSATTLSDPQSGVGDFSQLDLSQIVNWQVLGDFSSPGPFDISFDEVLISNDLPAPPPYPGYEPNAPWRAEAAARIEANRKSNVHLKLIDRTGLPLSGANVEVRMQQHEFGFGSAVQAVRLRDEAPQHATYKEKVAELFNIATIENNYKWPAWEGEWGSNFTQAGALAATDWLLNHNIDVRGHNLIWPGTSHLPNDLEALLSGGPLTPAEQQQVRDRIAARIAEVTSASNGKLVDWDVINEPRANHDVMDSLDEGNLAMVDWFQIADAATDAKLYLNEYSILASGGAISSSTQDSYFQTLQFLLDNGAPIDGIGLQGHFNEASLTGPEQLWAILDRFAALGLDMQVTEFDFSTSDEQLQADYTRDFLTAMFAHQGVDDFIMWGFWEDAHWRPETAMFRSDWSIKPNGEEFMNLVFNEWWTEEDLQSGSAGDVEFRGFKGDYLVTVEINGYTQVLELGLSEDQDLVALIDVYAADLDRSGGVDGGDLDALAMYLGNGAGGDIDGDGDTDGADFLIWQRQHGLPIVAVPMLTPEPAAWSLGLLGLLTHATRRRRC